MNLTTHTITTAIPTGALQDMMANITQDFHQDANHLIRLTETCARGERFQLSRKRRSGSTSIYYHGYWHTVAMWQENETPHGTIDATILPPKKTYYTNKPRSEPTKRRQMRYLAARNTVLLHLFQYLSPPIHDIDTVLAAADETIDRRHTCSEIIKYLYTHTGISLLQVETALKAATA